MNADAGNGASGEGGPDVEKRAWIDFVLAAGAHPNVERTRATRTAPDPPPSTDLGASK